MINGAYDPNLTVAQNLPTAMTFNQLGIMGGPLKNHDGTANVGGVVTITVSQALLSTSGEGAFTTIAQTTIDLTTWVPGQFYWSNPLPSPVNIWGTLTYPTTTYTYVYHVVLTCTTPYSLYTKRPVVLRNGKAWSSGTLALGTIPGDHLSLSGPVDLTFNNYVDLGRASLTPVFALSGQLQAEGHVSGPPISPQILFRSKLRTIGELDGGDIAPKVVLSATSIAGGPLWKPSKLCTG